MKKILSILISFMITLTVVGFNTIEVDASSNYSNECLLWSESGYYTVTYMGELHLCYNGRPTNNALVEMYDGRVRAFDNNGRLVRSDFYYRSSTSIYYANAEGYILQEEWLDLNNDRYYFDYSGRMESSGRVKINGANYFFNIDGTLNTDGWIKSRGDWYYSGADGSLVEGWLKVNNKWYYFDRFNVMISDQIYRIDGIEYQFNVSGAMSTNKWYYYSPFGWKYFKSNGAAASGWTKIGSKWSYFDSRNIAESNGIEIIKGRYYAFDKNSYMISNKWYKDDGSWYYLQPSGAAVENSWYKIGRKWSYFGYNGKAYTNETLFEKGFTYAFDKNSYMITNKWHKDRYGSWYYLNSNGKSAKGWKKISGKWYYFDTFDGEMYSNESTYINGKMYTFNSSGVWIY